MCKILKISRGMIYYSYKEVSINSEYENKIIEIFRDSRKNYGTRKIQKELMNKYDIKISRKYIGKCMNKYNLVSNYTKKLYKKQNNKCNEDNIKNILNRDFNVDKIMTVMISDLTYVNVKGVWHYVCLIIDLFNREIVGHAVSKHKTVDIVLKAFSKIKYNLNSIQIFHTDRGLEFKNRSIDKILETFNITRSLSNKGCPYDNAVAESTYKIFKTEFVKNRTFNSLKDLEIELDSYIYWYNNKRIHGSLNYLSPVKYKNMSL